MSKSCEESLKIEDRRPFALPTDFKVGEDVVWHCPDEGLKRAAHIRSKLVKIGANNAGIQPKPENHHLFQRIKPWLLKELMIWVKPEHLVKPLRPPSEYNRRKPRALRPGALDFGPLNNRGRDVSAVILVRFP